MNVRVARMSFAGLAGSLVIAAALAGSALASDNWPSDESGPVGETTAAPPSHEENDRGQTYGSLAEARVPGEEPELTLVVADNGVEGYIYSNELEPPDFTSPEEAVEWSESRGTIVIDVYEADGQTRIGTFTIEPGGSESK